MVAESTRIDDDGVADDVAAAGAAPVKERDSLSDTHTVLAAYRRAVAHAAFLTPNPNPEGASHVFEAVQVRVASGLDKAREQCASAPLACLFQATGQDVLRQKNATLKKFEEQLILGASCVPATRYGLWKAPQVTNEVCGLSATTA